MQQISKNFTLEELIGKSQMPSSSELDNLIAITTIILQPLRDRIGKIKITSGYRDKKYNELIGGAATSQHIKGQAVDFIPLEKNISEVFALIMRELPYDQVIHENKNGVEWIHVSYNKNGNRHEALNAEYVNNKMNYRRV